MLALLILLLILCNACRIEAGKEEYVSADEGMLADEGLSVNEGSSIITSERRDHPTPSGGDYSEIFYFDDDGNSVDKTIATKAIIREYKKDGTLTNETFADINNPK
jgi:hypothetical protein